MRLDLTYQLLVGVQGDVRAPKAARGFVCEMRDSDVEPDVEKSKCRLHGVLHRWKTPQ